jgi:hypothetical protein
LWGDQSSQGAMLVLPRGDGGTQHDTCHSPVWSTKCLPSMFGIGGCHQCLPTCFLSETCHGEAFYRLGFRLWKFWFSLVLYFH